ncbi:MAG: hypothetical protein NZ703_14810, partial [Gemmataceae bacterium]|nr:hypothetical protein [Gemmataceae bacterium]
MRDSTNASPFQLTPLKAWQVLQGVTGSVLCGAGLLLGLPDLFTQPLVRDALLDLLPSLGGSVLMTAWGVLLLASARQWWRVVRTGAMVLGLLCVTAAVGAIYRLPFCPLGMWFVQSAAGSWDCAAMITLATLAAAGLWLQGRRLLSWKQLLTVHLVGIVFVLGAVVVAALQSSRLAALPTRNWVWTISVLLLGISFLVVVFRQPEGTPLRHWFWPELIATLGLLSTLGLWSRVEHDMVLQVQRLVQAVAAQAQNNWEESIRSQRRLMEQFAEKGPLLPAEQFQEEV